MPPLALKAKSYNLAKDQYFAADAVADATLEERADFGSRITLWTQEAQTLLDDLQARVDDAEKTRRRAHDRILYTFTDYLAACLEA